MSAEVHAGLAQETKDFLSYLQKNPAVRSRIKAPRDKSLFYAGRFFKPIWKEIADAKRGNAAMDGLWTLPDALAQIPAPQGGGTMKEFVENLTEGTAAKLAWEPDGFTIWRALSGIFASNAEGKVYFCVGSGIDKGKVLAITEIGVLSRNAKIHPDSAEVVSWLQKCVREKNPEVNFGFVPA